MENSFSYIDGSTSMAFNIPLQNWLFHSADEVVRYHAVTDLYNGGIMLCILLSILWRWIMPEGAVWLSLVRWHEVWAEHRYRKEQKQYHFSVAPAFTDSLPVI